MATQNLRVYSGKEILLAYYNRTFQKNIALHEIQFGRPQRVDTVGTNFNTTINLWPNLGTRYYGSPKLNYDRVHVSLLGTIVVPKGQATRVHDLLETINTKYNLNLTDEDVENDTLDPFTNGDITVNLRIKEDSVMFYQGTMIYTPAYPDPNAGVPPVIDQYAFWSPTSSSPVVVLSNNNYTALMNNEQLAITQIPITEGRVYWEVKIDTDALLIGVGLPSAPRTITGGPVAGGTNHTWVLNTANGKLYHDSAEFNYTTTLVAGMTVGVLLDKNAGTLSFMLGNSVIGTAFTGLNLHNEVYPIIAGATSANARGTANFGEFPFFYNPPADYRRGVYTLQLPGGTTPPSSGGPSTNYPAGTVLSTFCNDEDKWNVLADGTGKFIFVVAEADSPDCGYDPANPPIYSGGDSTTGGTGKPTLTAVGGPFVMNENTPFNVPYTLSRALDTSLVLDFNVTYGTASAADITSFEYRMSNQASWTVITSGEQFIVPTGITNFSIRITPVADQVTEGLETLNLVISEQNLGEKLSNNAALNTAVVITDSSTNPAPYPSNPSTPVGWDAGLALNFETDNTSNYTLASSIAGSSTSWVSGGSAPSYLRFISTSGTSSEVNRYDLTTEAAILKRKSLSIQMKVSVSQTDTDNNAGFGITLYDLSQTPDPSANNGTFLRMIAPTTGASNANFRLVQSAAFGQIAQDSASLLVPGTIHTVEYRFYPHALGWYAEYWLDGAMQSQIDVPNTKFNDSLDFRVGISAFGNTQVKIYTVNYSTKPLLAPRSIRLQGAGQFTVPAGQITVELEGRGDKGISNSFKIEKALTNRIVKMHRGGPSLVPSGVSYAGTNRMIDLNGVYFGYQEGTGSSFLKTTDFDSFTFLNEQIAIKQIVKFKGKLYFHFANNAAGYATNKLYTSVDGVAFAEVPGLTLTIGVGDTLGLYAFDERLFVTDNAGTFTTVDGENWLTSPVGIARIVKTVSGYTAIKNTTLETYVTVDGENWTQATTLPVDSISNFISGNGVIAYLSSYNQIVYSSDNAQTWNTQSVPDTVNYLFYANGLFVAPGTSTGYAYKGASISTMTRFDRQTVECGATTLPGYIRPIKNRFVCPADLTNVTLISSNLEDWVPLSIYNYTAVLNSFVFDDLVAVKLASLNNLDYSFATIEVEDSVVISQSGIVGTGCEATVGSTTYSFPLSANSTVPTARTYNVNVPSNAPVVVDFDAQVGTYLKLTFLDQPYSGTAIDTFIAENCQGLDVIRRYADGAGSEYIEVVSKNSATCGYIADTAKEVTLTGNGVFTVPAGSSEITVAGRGSSLQPAVLSQATVADPVNLDRYILPDGYRASDIAYGAGVYVAIGYISNVAGWFSRKLFHSPDMRNWTASSYAVPDSHDRVTWVINRFYVTATYENGGLPITSATGLDDWTEQYSSAMLPSMRAGKPVTLNGKAFVASLGYSASRYGTTTDAINWTHSGWDYSHAAIGILNNGSAIVSYGYGNSFSYPDKYIRSTTDGVSWNDHTIANLANHEGQVQQLVCINGTYFGLYKDRSNVTKFTYIGYIRGTSLNNLELTVTPAGTYIEPKLFVVGNYFVIIDVEEIRYSADAQTWVTVPTPGEFLNGIQFVTNIYSTAILNSDYPGFLTMKNVLVGEQRVSVLPKLGKPAIVSVGDKIEVYSGNTYNSALASIETHTYPVDTGDETIVVYSCPEGSSVKISFMGVDDGAPANGTQLNTYCDGYNNVGVYANGFGGTYTEIIETNAPSCGYTPPVVKASINSTPYVQVTEGETATITYSLSQPLDADVGFVVTITDTTTNAADYTNLRSVIAGVEANFDSGDEIIVPAGETSIIIKIDAIEDNLPEAIEYLDATLTPATNSSRITNASATTTVGIRSIIYVVQPTSITYDNTNDQTRFYSYYVNGSGMVDRAGLILTSPVTAIDKFYIPLPSFNLKTMIIGFGTTMVTTSDNDNYVYPGMDNYGWGITEGGYWHMGVFTPIASTWNYEPIGILLDRVNGTMDLVINGVPQNYGITGMPTTGSLVLLTGTKDIPDPQGFYIELDNRDVTGYTPPLGYLRGFGEVVVETAYTPPPTPPADGKLTPAKFTTQLSDGRGAVFVYNGSAAISDLSVNEGIWQFQVVATSTKPFRIGICNAGFSTSTQLGDDGNSWAVDSTLTNTYHNGGQTPIPNGGRWSNNTTIHVTVDLFNNYIRFYGQADYIQTFSGELPPGPLYIALSSSTTLAEGGVRVYVNTGTHAFSEFNYDANPGFGTYIGTPAEGTPISTYCDGIALMGLVYDANGNPVSRVEDAYSLRCGYVPPDPAVVGWRTDLFPPKWVVTEPGNEIMINNGDGWIRSTNSYSSGKHFWTFDNADSLLYIGFANSFHDVNAVPGQTPESIRIDLQSSDIFQNGAYYSDLYDDFYTQVQYKNIGIMLDQDLGKLYIKYENGTIKEITSYVAIPGDIYLIVGVGYQVEIPSVNINLGQVPFTTIAKPAGYLPWFSAETAWPVVTTASYLDDFENVNKEWPSMNIVDTYDVYSIGGITAQHEPSVRAYRITQAQKELATRGSNFITSIDAPFINNVRMTLDINIPKVRIMNTSTSEYSDIDFDAVLPSGHAYVESVFSLSAYDNNAGSVSGSTIDLFMCRDTDIPQRISAGTSNTVDGPGLRSNTTMGDFTVSLPRGGKIRIVLEVYADGASKRHKLYVNGDLLLNTTTGPFAFDSLVKIAMGVGRLSSSIIDLRRMMIENMDVVTDNREVTPTIWSVALSSPSTVLSNSNRTAQATSSTALTEFAATSGKYYAEVSIASGLVGVACDGINVSNPPGSGARSIAYRKSDGKIITNGSDSGFSLTAGASLIRMLIDIDNKLLWMYADANTTPVLLGMSGDNFRIACGDGTSTLNAGGAPFAYTVPSGYTPGFGQDLDKYNNRLAFVATRLDVYDKGTDITFSSDGFRILSSNDGSGARARFGISSGKWAWEVTPKTSGADCVIGIGRKETPLQDGAGAYPGAKATDWGYYGGANKVNNDQFDPYGATYTNNDVITVLLDMDNGILSFLKNGVNQGVMASGLTGTFYPHFGGFNNCTMDINFGQKPFAYPIPYEYTAGVGFKSFIPTGWNTAIMTENADYAVTGNGGTSVNFIATGKSTAISFKKASAGKWAWEMRAVADAANMSIGIARPDANPTTDVVDPSGYAYSGNGNVNGVAYGASYTAGDIITVLLDLEAGTLSFMKNGVSQGVAATGLTGEWVATLSKTLFGSAPVADANFGDRPFKYPIPVGYSNGFGYER